MRILENLRQHVGVLLAPALNPASSGPRKRPILARAEEARRKSVHDVTMEQLGITHWTFHTLF